MIQANRKDCLTAQYYLITHTQARTMVESQRMFLVRGLGALRRKTSMRNIRAPSSLGRPPIIQHLCVHSSHLVLITSGLPFHNYTYSCRDEGSQKRIAAVVWLEKNVTTVLVGASGIPSVSILFIIIGFYNQSCMKSTFPFNKGNETVWHSKRNELTWSEKLWYFTQNQIVYIVFQEP